MAEDREALERTEKATPKRRRETREKGHVAKSVELNTVFMLGCGLLLGISLHSYLVEGAKEAFARFFLMASAPGPLQERIKDLYLAGAASFFQILAPVLVGTVVIAIAANTAQVGFHPTAAALEPKPERLNPAEGLKRLLSKRSLVELAKGILKIILVGSVAYLTYHSKLGDLDRFMFLPPQLIVPETVKIAALFLMRAVIVLGVLAILDYAYQRWEFERSIMMTRQELKEELKESEGDPLIKSRVRSIQHQIARQRMMQDVKKADVVVTNPTHYAVALAYNEADVAPRVLAKGRNLIAEKIKEIAREHRIPILERPVLARLLYRECKVGKLIPTTLYEAVAEVLAYVYSLKRRVIR